MPSYRFCRPDDIPYLVRAVTPGDYALPGVFLEDMYKRQFRALGPAARIEVVAAQ